MRTPPTPSLLAAAVVLIALLLPSSATQAQTPETVVAIRASAMVDVESGRLLPNAVIVVRGDHIEASGSDIAIPSGAEVIDLGDAVLLPGLIDTHTHVCIQPDYSENNPILYKSIPLRTVEAVDAARRTLHAGFTTIRDVDSEGADWVDVAIRDGIDQGLIEGPRMQVATLALSITGGYMNQVGLAPQIDAPQYGSLVDDPASIVGEVRRQIKYGADWIKIYATGTVRNIDPTTMQPLPQFSFDELKLTVDEAARFRTPVSAHAYGGPGADDAIRAGVRSIEHGMLMSDATLDLLVEHGTFWVPTISVYFPDRPRSEWPDLTTNLIASHERTFRSAVAKGVKIAYGTDAGAIPHGENAIDFARMVEYGMTPLQAVQSATLVAAELMQLDGQVGTLRPGALADVVAVAGNPLEDVGVLDDVRFVMKGGKVVR